MKSKLNLIYSIISVIILCYILYTATKPLEIPEDDLKNINTLEELYSAKKYSKTIEYANNIIKSDDYVTPYKTFYRGVSYYKLGEFKKALSDIEYTIDKNGRGDYFLYFTRAKLYEHLKILDTSKICSDITVAINSKGNIISSQNLKLDHMDSTNLFDVNYIEMLKLRVKYCKEEMPLYTDMDLALINKTK